MANPQFSADKSYPITLKPLTDPREIKTHRDLFNMFNSFRMLVSDLDAEFQEIHDELDTKIGEAPIDGKIYGRKDGNWTEVTGGGGGGSGGGALEFLQEIVITAAQQDISFNGLNTDADELYQIELLNVPNSTAAQNISLYYNTDFTAANYRTVYVSGSTGASAAVLNTAELLNMGNNTTELYSVTINIKKLAGRRPSAATNPWIGFGPSVWFAQFRASQWLNTTNVTSIVLRHTSVFGVGTKARLYRLRKDNAAGMLPAYMDPKTGQYWMENFSRILGPSEAANTNFTNTYNSITYLISGGSRASYADTTSSGITLITGSNAAGGSRHFFGIPQIRTGGGEIRIKAVIILTQALTAAQDAQIAFGLFDLVAGAPVARVNAELRFANNSYRWYISSYTGGVQTVTNTTVAAPIPGVRTTLELVINAAGTQAELWIGGVLGGTATINIPIPVAVGIMLNKTVGTTSVSCTVLYVEYKKVYTTPLP